MIYTETESEAASIAKAALDEMNAEGVAPNPQNFAIWFEYLTGRNSALVRYIDRAREKKVPLTPDRHHDIFEKFFAMGADGGAPEGWTEKIEAAAGRIVEALTTAGEGKSAVGRESDTEHAIGVSLQTAANFAGFQVPQDE